MSVHGYAWGLKCMARTVVNLGDLFLKSGHMPSKWVVEKLIQRPDFPDHVRLRKKGHDTKTITVALSVLSEGNQFKLLERAG